MDTFRLALQAHRAGQLDVAERGYRAVLEQGDHDEAWGNLGLVLGLNGSPGAEAALRKAVALRPDRAAHHHNLGNYLRRAGRVAEARVAFATAWALDPHLPDLSIAYGNTLLALGDRTGWALYDQRPERLRSQTHRLSFPEWQGERLEGKRLFVWAEQGYGDQILAARYLTRCGAADVTVACPAALVRLFEQLPVTVIPQTDQTRVESHDYWAMMMSLPRWIEGPLWTGPYFSGRGERRGQVGLAWRGNAMPDPGRSLPENAALEILSLPGVINLDPTISGAQDFADTADIIDELELVVSVDTSVAHLAGAMQKPLVLLLQHNSADWRWEQPWYGDVTILRQPVQGNWDAPIASILASLKQGGSG